MVAVEAVVEEDGLFTDVAAAAGVQFAHVGDAPITPLGGRVAFGDFDNEGDGTFADVSDLFSWRLRSGAGFAAGFVDYDDDGNMGSGQFADRLRLAGIERGVLADGREPLVWCTLSKVQLTAVGQTQVRQIQSGGSLGAGNDIAAHFGLGAATQVERLEIEWPSGIVQILTELPGNQVVTVTEATRSEVARAVAFLASDESGMMTGSIVDFDQSV